MGVQWVLSRQPSREEQQQTDDQANPDQHQDQLQHLSGIALLPPYRLGMEQQGPERMHTAKELSEMTGLPYRAILSACRSGSLASYRLSQGSGGRLYISEQDFARWLESCKANTAVASKVSLPRQAAKQAGPKSKLGSIPIEELAL